MAFAIFYNDVDMANIQTLYDERLSLSATAPDKALFLNYWGGGVKDWATAPLGQSPYEQFIAANTARRIVVSYGTLTEFRALLKRLLDANRNHSDGNVQSAVLSLYGVWDDMGRNCGGVEPWPVV